MNACRCGCGRPALRRYASTACRVRAWRERQRGTLLSVTVDRNARGSCSVTPRSLVDTLAPRVRVLAYADPPYPGRAHLYPEAEEVDHRELLQSLGLCDGWALSTARDCLPQVLALCPPGVEVGAWTWPQAGRPARVRRQWEPVIFSGWERAEAEGLADLLRAAPPGVPGFVGAKPVELGEWVCLLLGARPGDVLIDMFPGTGAIGRAAVRMGLRLVTPAAGIRYGDVEDLVTKARVTGPATWPRYDGRRNEALVTGQLSLVD